VTKRVTVSVPDELHEKLEAWKGKLNFSKVFQDAVSVAMGKKRIIRRE